MSELDYKRGGRSRHQRLGEDPVAGVAKRPGLNSENVMVCFVETLWKNWSFGGDRFINT